MGAGVASAVDLASPGESAFCFFGPLTIGDLEVPSSESGERAE